MTRYDLQFFMDKGACYDPADVLGEGWTGTALDILNMDSIPVKDRIWAGIQCLSEKDQRLFAVRCVRETPIGGGRFVVDLLSDERSLDALVVAEKYARGEATEEELSTAWDAAWDAAMDAAWDAAMDAAMDAAWDAAMAAAMDAAWAAARAADGAADGAAQLTILKSYF